MRFFWLLCIKKRMFIFSLKTEIFQFIPLYSLASFLGLHIQCLRHLNSDDCLLFVDTFGPCSAPSPSSHSGRTVLLCCQFGHCVHKSDSNSMCSARDKVAAVLEAGAVAKLQSDNKRLDTVVHNAFG